MTNAEILREFLLETHENLALLDADLVTLEKKPTEKNTLAQVFRTLHSVKGTAGFMGLVKLQAVAHSAESLLSKLRAGELLFNPAIATAMLRVVDAIREMLTSIESTGDEGTGDYTDVIYAVDRLRENQTVTHVQQSSTTDFSLPAGSAHTVDLAGITTAPLALSPLPTTDEPPSDQSPSLADVSPSETILVPPLEGTPEGRTATVADSNIRVDVGLLDQLMTLVGELVLARNQILQHSAGSEQEDLLGAVQRLNLLTTELQTSVMKTRMQPIGNVLNRFPRVVRDLAIACGKQVRFEMEGQDTELDRTLLEAIRDPLTHMVRNAVDHGIEAPEIRRSQGKTEEGRLRMMACHEEGKVIIEISDDGRGIDVARVREKALSAHLVSPDVVGRMSRQDLLRLIFLPGFSTAEQVTQFSGRGVGMDVVRTNIEKIGGSIDIESQPGQGTTIRTKIPLTLAIIPALIIVSGGERYAIPQVSLLELVWLEAGQTTLGIEWVQGAPVYRLRGSLLPLLFLDEQLELAVGRTPTDDLKIVVLQADDRPFGLVVDAIRDTEEIVVKPLQKQVKDIPVFAGAAIMGDGRVALVLDVLGIAQRASVIAGSKSRSLSSEQVRLAPAADSEGQTLLLFSPSAGGQMAIPLAQVARLEEFPRTALESIGAQRLIQYRGEILPLVDVSEELESLRVGGRSESSTGSPLDSSELVPVVVYAADNRRIGLLVSRILDVVHDKVAARSPANRPGVLFTAIVQAQVTEFLDVAAIIRHVTTDTLLPAV